MIKSKFKVNLLVKAILKIHNILLGKRGNTLQWKNQGGE